MSLKDEFTTGRIIFASLFVVAFVAVIAYSYSKDRGIHRKHYRNAKWILISFVAFVGLLFLVKFLLNL